MNEGERLREHRVAADAAFDWCLHNGLRMESQGNVEHAAEWAMYAAWTAIRCGHPYLCSEPLESLLVRLGTPLATKAASSRRRPAGPPARWLHVFTRTYPIGGHSALARRWIKLNSGLARHDLVVTEQSRADVAPNLAVAVERAGGCVVSLRNDKSALGRARRLREMAADCADVVVLHTSPRDIAATLAFAAAGGPPVLLMNHADHSFWTGVAAADLVVDFRDSGLHLSRALRGVTRSAVLPLPLPDLGPAQPDRATAAARMKDPRPLGRDLMLLTIGNESKYLAMPHLNFRAAAMRIVEEVPDCAIIGVGPPPESPFWQKLNADSGGRIVAVGADPDLVPWHAAADLFLEGFPRGSYTALLEVALAGRAFVRKPWLAPPGELPVDRGALADFEPPQTPEAYAEAAIELCRNAARREAQAERARAAVLATHCHEGWAAALASLVRSIPARHEPPGPGAAAPLPPGLQYYWDEYYRAFAPLEPFKLLLEDAMARGFAVLPPPYVKPPDPGPGA